MKAFYIFAGLVLIYLAFHVGQARAWKEADLLDGFNDGCVVANLDGSGFAHCKGDTQYVVDQHCLNNPNDCF